MSGGSALSFAVCSSDDATLTSNLLASPCLAEGRGHEVVAIRNGSLRVGSLRVKPGF